MSGITEARVDQLISTQINKLSESFAASAAASFVAIQDMRDSKLSNGQDVTNLSFSASSPVPVRLSPSQGQQNPSISNKYIT